jgi:hypothetical protein
MPAYWSSRLAPPRLPVATDYARKNVTVERADPASMLSLYRRELRRSLPALTTGAYRSVETGHPNVFTYLRDCRLIARSFASFCDGMCILISCAHMFVSPSAWSAMP